MMISNCFYYGVYSPKGFYSLASKPTFAAERNYVVKGFSDFAKQRLFDSIKNELDKRGCSYVDFCADDRSMGVYSQDAGFRIIDTTYETSPIEAEAFSLSCEKNAQYEKWLVLRQEAVLRTQRFRIWMLQKSTAIQQGCGHQRAVYLKETLERNTSGL